MKWDSSPLKAEVRRGMGTCDWILSDEAELLAPIPTPALPLKILWCVSMTL